MPKEIEQLAAQYLNQPVKVKIGRVSVPTANVAQSLEAAPDGQKLELLVDMLQVVLEGWQGGGDFPPAGCAQTGLVNTHLSLHGI